MLLEAAQSQMATHIYALHRSAAQISSGQAPSASQTFLSPPSSRLLLRSSFSQVHIQLPIPTFHVRRRNAPRVVLAQSSRDRGSKGGEEVKQHADASTNGNEDVGMLSSLLARLLESWQGLSLSQKAYTLLLGLVLLLLLPRLLLLLLVPIERALLAVLIAAEELTAVLLLKTMSLAAAVGVAGLLIAGVFIFAGKKEESN